MKKHFFLAAAVLLSAGVATTSCSNEELVQTEQKKSEGTSYMSLLIGLPQMGGTRAAADGQDKTKPGDVNDKTPDFNYKGEWTGKDLIENLTVYVFKGEDDNATLEKVQTFSKGQFELKQPYAGNPTAFIKPLKGIQVTPGKKQVVVVVNGEDADDQDFLKGKVNALLPHDPVNTTLQAFKGKLASAELNLAGNNAAITKTTAANLTTIADRVAKVKDSKDKILMTGEVSVAVDVKDGVTEKTTLDTEINRAKVQVQRAAARVLVTTSGATEFPILGDDPTTAPTVETNVELGKLTNLKFSVAQGERTLYFVQQRNADPTDDVWAFKTPASDFVPEGVTATGLSKFNSEEGDIAANASKYYDYTGLWRNYQENTSFGVEVKAVDLHTGGITAIQGELDKGVFGEFLLPNTHEYAAAPTLGQKYTGKYRKGNTAYVLVRGVFKPKFVTDETGVSRAVADGEYTTTFAGFQADDVNGQHYDAVDVPGTFVLGSNGKFYKNLKDAQTNVPGMECQVFKGGVMLYYAWINPDIVTDTPEAAPRWFNSPVLRNNIYHIQIKGIKNLGINWNPLVPGDPTKPNGNDGNDGDPNTPGLPSNPDPKPNNPFEPKTPPVNPNDDLTPKDTWMSVETKILPWEVHSYELDLR